MRPGRWAPQGQGFDYSGANTFVLSWIVEKLSNGPKSLINRHVRVGIGARI